MATLLLFALDGRHLYLGKYVWCLRYYLMSRTNHTCFSSLLETLGDVGASVKIVVPNEEIWAITEGSTNSIPYNSSNYRC